MSISDKKKIREAWRKQYPKETEVLAQASRKIVENLCQIPQLQSARWIALYWPLPWEVDLLTLWKWRPRACVFPRVDPKTKQMSFHLVTALDQMRPGFGKISEPGPECREIKLGPLDLVLIPGYAFDRSGARIGSGLGFYDRYLAGTDVPHWGVCFHAQISNESLAQDETDVRMDALCSEQGWNPRQK